MNQIGIAVFWCAVQVTVVSTLAIPYYLVQRRKGPSAGAFASFTTLVIVTCLSAFTFSPWPSWRPTLSMVAGEVNSDGQRSHGGGPNPVTTDVTEIPASRTMPAEAAGRRPPLPVASAHAPSLPANLPELLASSLSDFSGSAENSTWRWPAVLAAAMAIGIAAASIRFAWGLFTVVATRRSSRRLEDRFVSETLDVLCARLRCGKPVELRESAKLPSPATIGWLRPLILLPAHWRTWSQSELSAVLAHEVAHICRNDFLRWSCAQFGPILHFYHPLVHWLAARLRLEQELAADATAAAVVGGEQTYLRTLVQMALRQQPDRSMLSPAQTFLPTRRNFLRRIEMLRATKKLSTQVSPRARLFCLGFLVLAGVGAAGLRSQTGDSSDSSRNPFATLGGLEQGAGETEAGSIELMYVPVDAHVVAAIRPAAILRHPAVAEIGHPLNSVVRLREQFGLPLEKIEQISIVVSGPQHRARRGPVRMALGPTIVRCLEPIPAETVRSIVRNRVKTSFAGEVYYGDDQSGICYFQPDEKTFLIAEKRDLERLILSGKRVRSAMVRTKSWEQVKHGHLAIAISGESLGSFVKQLQDQDLSRFETLSAVSPLWEEPENIVVGGKLDRGLSISGSIQCAGERGARRVVETLSAVRTLARNAIRNTRKLSQDAPDSEFALLTTILDLADELVERTELAQESNVVSFAVKSETPDALIRVLAGSLAARTRPMSSTQRNLRQIGIALHNYHDVHGRFPPARLVGPDGKTVHSWRVALLPFLNHQALYDKYRLNEPWDSPHNQTLLREVPDVYRASHNATELSATPYLALAGDETAIGTGVGTKLREILDGTSNTIAVVQTRTEVNWTEPRDLPYASDLPLPPLGGRHSGGVSVLLCDGSTKLLPASIDERSLRAMITKAGNERIDWAAVERARPASSESLRRPEPGPTKTPEATNLGNLKSLAIAMHNYHSVHGHFPPASLTGPDGKAVHSWRVALLPYLNQTALYKQYNLEEPWDSPNNLTLLKKMPAVFRHPSAAPNSFQSDYYVLVGPRSAFSDPSGVELSEIHDGTSNTLMIVETNGEVDWTKPEDLSFSKADDLPKLGGFGTGKFNASLCDGSAMEFAEDIDRTTLHALVTINGREPIDLRRNR